MLQINLTPSLLNETGSFTIATSGNGYLGFFFCGSDDFIERCVNLCINYGMLQTGKVHSFHDGSRYILTPADRLHNGIKQYFVNQIIVENPKEINKQIIFNDDGAAIDITWDEAIVDNIAQQRLEEFLKTRVEYKNLLEYEGGIQNHVEYGFGTIGETKTALATD